MKFLILILILSGSVFAGGKTYGLRICEVVRVYDGDTFYCNIKNADPLVGDSIGIRPNGVDTPEIRTKDQAEKYQAKKAKKFTEEFLKGGVVELRNVGRGKYFRISADVYVDGKSLTKALIEAGLGYAYFGGRKRKWK